MKTMIHVFHGRKKNTSKEIKQKNGDIDVQQVLLFTKKSGPNLGPLA